MQALPKLVRNHIPALIVASGRTCEVEVLEGEQFDRALRTKLTEESAEVGEALSPDELMTELADVLEIVEALAQWHNLDLSAIRTLQEARRAERGGFEQRLQLITIR